MSLKKKTTSKVVQFAAARAAGMESIAPTMDFGDGLTHTAYKAAIADAQTKLAAYNSLLAQVDEARGSFGAAEDNVRDLSDRMLAATAARFGRESSEYQKAGGTRKSDRKTRGARAQSEVKTAA